MESFKVVWSQLQKFEKAEVDKLPSGSAGVFRLSYKHENSNIYVFYIGQADDIKTKLTDLLDNANICVKNYILTKECYFRYSKIEEEYVRKATERLMFKRYVPQCNEKIPEGREDIEINLS